MKLKDLYKCGIVFLAGCIIAIAIAYARGAFEQTTLEMVKMLSDGFLIPGVVLAGLGALTFVSNKGSFDILVFSIRTTIGAFTSNREFRNKYKDYYEYYNEKRKKNAPVLIMLLPGLLLLLISFIFVLIFNNIYYS